MAVKLYSAQVTGLDAQPISVEVDVTPGLHIFSIVGLADKEVQESRERISAAIKNIGAQPPHKKSQRVIINLAPADIKKEGPAHDLPIALGYLLASGQVIFNPGGKIFLGELGLDGTLRRVRGVLPIAMAAKLAGFEKIFLPKGNGSEASRVEGVEVREIESLGELIEYLSGRKDIKPVAAGKEELQEYSYKTDLKDIRGQEKAKRALEIAAAGGHHLLMVGPPGAGKTLLAQALPTILPPLSFEEALEVTKIYSVSGILENGVSFMWQRPFRNPHHTSSYTSVIGGGSNPRPGEITLAHRGVLFLDEMPEFDRRVIEALRQPLEEHKITVARTQETQTFPAKFMLVAAQNPCPCGNFGHPRKDCSCSPGMITRYSKKISGPMLDRVDMHIETPEVAYEKLEGKEGEDSSTVRERVAQAREIQKKRLAGANLHTNSEMGLKEIKRFIEIKAGLKPTLKLAHERHGLSARSYHRVLKLSRTIADLEGSKDIEERHIAEALQYRPKVE